MSDKVNDKVRTKSAVTRLLDSSRKDVQTPVAAETAVLRAHRHTATNRDDKSAIVL